MPLNGGAIGGGIRPGSGKVMADGGGRPRCGVLIFAGTLACSEGKTLRSALNDVLGVEEEICGTKSWAVLKSYSDLVEVRAS